MTKTKKDLLINYLKRNKIKFELNILFDTNKEIIFIKYDNLTINNKKYINNNFDWEYRGYFEYMMIYL